MQPIAGLKFKILHRSKKAYMQLRLRKSIKQNSNNKRFIFRALFKDIY